ncbi:hypothetical protein HID58_015462 [Brassica napus]|uniref:Uncharacterized protein n=1 Tax=Brassica napus TaxID=3708 RepID=A0ABQ8DK51_BRANA|nr:hypothetical protein HID58_015462 [Brassica napus]
MKLFTITMMTIMAISIVFVQVPSTTEARPLEITENKNHFKVTSLNNFVSTIPVGHNVDGHKEGIELFQEKILKNIYAYAPTDPGNSPGIGHHKMDVHAPELSNNFKVVRPLEITENKNHFKVMSLNNFVSTVPEGHNVDGHKEGIEVFQAKILKNIYAYAPTDPGNSPGIGHHKMDVHAPARSNDFKVVRKLKKN